MKYMDYELTNGNVTGRDNLYSIRPKKNAILTFQDSNDLKFDQSYKKTTKINTIK